MKRFVEGDDRKQVALLPECVDDYICQDNPVRIVDVFVDELDLITLGFNGTTPAITGRPSYHPGVMLKIYYTVILVISTGYHRAGDWRANASAMLS